MLKRISLLIALLIPILFVSCFKEEDFGYPSDVVFTNDGGEQVITGEVPFTHAEIIDHKSGEDGEIYISENSEIVVFNWLKIEYPAAGSYELKVYAEPNNTGKSRQLCIEVYSAMEYQEIKVLQKK